MKPKKLMLFLFVLGLFSVSCTDSNVTGPEESSANIRSLDGKIELVASNSTIDLDELDISSFHEEDDIRGDNTFDIDIAKSEHPQFVFAVNQNDDFVMASFVDDADTEVVINEITTAQAMVLLNVVFLTYTPDEKEMVLDIATRCPSFGLLVQEISKILTTDPDNVFNGDVYPDINRLSATVSLEVLERFFSGGLQKSQNSITIGSVSPEISIKGNDNRYVTFSNPNFVFMCGQAVCQQTGKEENVFTLGRRKGVLKRALIIPYGITDAEQTDTKFNNNNSSYYVTTTKGFNYVSGIANVKEAFNWNTIYGRATILNFLVGAGEVIKLAGLGVAVTVVEQLPLAWDIIGPYFKELQQAVKEGDYIKASQAYIKIVSASIGVLTAAGGAILIEQKTGFFGKLKKAFKFIQDNIPFYSQIEKAEILANETIPFLVDMFAGEGSAKYGIRTDENYNVYAAGKMDENKPVKPTIWINRDEKAIDIDLKICSVSNIEKELQYYIYIKHHGPNMSGSIEFTTDFYSINKYLHENYRLENYTTEFSAVAIDKAGNRSPESKYVVKY